MIRMIVGLGNPGRKYARTRHNIGFRVVDQVARRLMSDKTEWQVDEKSSASYITGSVHGRDLIVAKPMTYMNHSGKAVKALVERFGIVPGEMIVVHDDKDISLGELKFQENRGAAGHNGIKSIISNLGTKDFKRLRVGIASRNPAKMKDTVKFVLGRFGILEYSRVKAAVNQASSQLLDRI